MILKDQDKFESIVILRGLAALSVCLYHFSNGLPGFLADTNLLKVIGAYGCLGVEIFFIISGFIIPLSLYKGGYAKSNIGAFFSKRLIRIEPPYFISIALAILLKYLSTLSSLYHGPEFNLNIDDLFYHVGYLCDIFNKEWIVSVYWTLAIEFQFYILIAVCYSYLFTVKKAYIFYVGLVLLNIPACLEITNTAYVFHYIPYFTLGIILFRTLIEKDNSIQFYIALILILIEVFFLFGLVNAIISLFTVLTIVLVKKSTPVLTFLGNISFSLYLLHILIGSRIINLSVNFTNNETYRVGIIFIALLVSIACAYVFYIIVEKPFIKLSQKITYHKK